MSDVDYTETGKLNHIESIKQQRLHRVAVGSSHSPTYLYHVPKWLGQDNGAQGSIGAFSICDRPNHIKGISACARTSN